MTLDLSGLGELIRAFRLERGLSQDALAQQVSPATNRSVVAHLEQGLRLPQAGIIRATCEYLNIPKPLWERFVVRADEFRDGRIGARPNERPRYIAIAGISGSGKTTLARSLANSMGSRYLPTALRGKEYISDLTHDPHRWAFEAQLSFLSSKALEVREALTAGIPFVLDRSLQEDIYVFAEYFRSCGQIAERAFETYKTLADHFLSVLPPPDLIVFCRVDADTALARIKARRRTDVGLHTPEYMKGIHDLSERWVNSYKNSTICVIDSSSIDWRESKNIQTIVHELGLLWSHETTTTPQLDLFSESVTDRSQAAQTETAILRMQVDRRPVVASTGRPASEISPEVLPFPSAYIAAPFTAVAESEDALKTLSPQLFAPAHGRIPRRRYRRTLEAMDAALRQLGLHTLLPHRDINGWGSIQLTPQQVTRQCSQQVGNCDVIVALPGTSHGTHFELGIARGLGKPCIVIHCDELQESFIASGLVNEEKLLELRCTKLSEIPTLLKRQPTSDFLSRFIPLRLHPGS